MLGNAFSPLAKNGNSSSGGRERERKFEYVNILLIILKEDNLFYDFNQKV